ncbi:MAG: efflux RND transporter periplasmic adaptor subunit [Clostridia bacterium]|nr:efflux RND transporter periplasmic adaptor subunit [Clostridia bacterium]
MNKKISFRTLGVASVIAVGMGLMSGCGVLPKEEKPLAPPLIQPKRQKYELYKVAKRDIVDSVKGSGEAIPIKSVPLYFKEEGRRIKSVDARIGQVVKKGDVLARIDVGDIESRIKQQQYMVSKAQIQLEQLEKQEEAARIDLKSMQTVLKNMKEEYDSSMKLPAASRPPIREMKNGITVQEYAVEKAKVMLEQMSKQKESARLDLINVQETLEELKNEREKSQLVSPMDGQVVFVEDIRDGDTVIAFKELVRVADTRQKQIYFRPPTAEVGKVKTGMTAELTYENKKYTGKVVLSPDNVPEDAGEAYKGAIVIDAKGLEERMKLGDPIVISIPIKSKNNTIVIPKMALKQILEKKYVQILEGDNKREVDVEEGITTPMEVEIISGLSEGQNVILN